MRTDYSYCTGSGCPIKDSCKRYLDYADDMLWWVQPSFDKRKNKCINHESITDIGTGVFDEAKSIDPRYS